MDCTAISRLASSWALASAVTDDAASAAAEVGVVDVGVGATPDVVQGYGAAKAAGVGGAEGVFVVTGDRGDG